MRWLRDGMGPSIHEVLTFLLGAFGFVHELFWAGMERPFIISASLALMGFPFVTIGARRLNGKKNGKEPE